MADKPQVEAFAARLRARGIDACLDKWEISSEDDVVAAINQGLAQCDVGLVFFSNNTAGGKWVRAEVSALIHEMIEEGRPIIPVMIDADADVPPLLRPRARRGIDEFDQIVDAILNRRFKPALSPPPGSTYTEHSTRAGEYRLWRAENVSHSLEDGIEATRNFLSGGVFDRAASAALGVLHTMERFGRLTDAAAFAAEVLRDLPPTHGEYAPIADSEAAAHLALGYTDRALARYQQLLDRHRCLSHSEPDRADYQRDLSVSCNKMGDLMVSLGQGDAARQHYQNALAIRDRLSQSEPNRADHLDDLAISLMRVASVDPQHAVERLERALRIVQALDAQGRLSEQRRPIVKAIGDMLAKLQAGGS